MTDAPERIWFVHVGKNIVPNSKRTGPKDVEYIRADLTPSPEVVKELVEALRAIIVAADKVGGYEEYHNALDAGAAILAKLEGGE